MKNMMLRSIAVSVLVVLGAGSFAAATNFYPPLDTNTGSGNTCDGVSADFDSDGKTDIALAGDFGVDVYNGIGAGRFSPPVRLAPADPVGRLICDDFDNDGDLDLAGTLRTLSSIRLFRNQGGGVFVTAQTLAVVNLDSRVLAAGRIRPDGAPDLAVATDTGFTLLENQGNGTFAAGETVPLPVVKDIVGIDLDLNGFSELAVQQFNQLKTFAFDGVRLQEVQSVSSPLNGRINAALVGADSFPDVVVRQEATLLPPGSPTSTGIQVFQGDGALALDPRPAYQVPGISGAIAGLDFNGDGAGDTMSGEDSGNGGPTLIRPVYDTPSGPAVSLMAYPVPDRPVSLLTADFNNDSIADTAAVLAGGGFSLMLGVGAATYAPADHYAVGARPVKLAAVDVDSDSDLDLAVALAGDGKMVILTNQGDGTFTRTYPDLPAGSEPSGVAAAALVGGGLIDLTVADLAGDRVAIYAGTGPGMFAPAVWVDLGPGDRPSDLTAADVNRDGLNEIVTANSGSNSVSVLTDTGAGYPATPSRFTAGIGPSSVAVFDMDDDGSLDIVTSNAGEMDPARGLSVLWGRGNGTFSPPAFFTAGQGPISVGVGDLDSDGLPDIAVANQGDATVSVLLNIGVRTFMVADGFTAGQGPTSIELTEANCDGMLDLAVTDGPSGDVLVFLNEGAGTFSPPQRFTAGQGPTFVVSADLDRTGRDDLAVTNADGGDVSVLLNGQCDTVTACVEEAQAPLTTVCPDVWFTLEAPPGFASYRWSTGETGPFITLAIPPAEASISVRCTAADGCVLIQAFPLALRPALRATLVPSAAHVCVSPQVPTPVDFSVTYYPAPPAGEKDQFDFRVAPELPGFRVERLVTEEYTAWFPAGAPAGSYEVTLQGRVGPDDCGFEASFPLRIFGWFEPWDANAEAPYFFEKAGRSNVVVHAPPSDAPHVVLFLASSKQELQSPTRFVEITGRTELQLDSEILPAPLTFIAARSAACTGS